MTGPYSNDLRERVVCAHLDGKLIRQAAARFEGSGSSLPKQATRCRPSGNVEPGPISSLRSWRLKPHRGPVPKRAATTPQLIVDLRRQRQPKSDGISVRLNTVRPLLCGGPAPREEHAVRPRADVGGGGPQAGAVAGAPAPA